MGKPEVSKTLISINQDKMQDSIDQQVSSTHDKVSCHRRRSRRYYKMVYPLEDQTSVQSARNVYIRRFTCPSVICLLFLSAVYFPATSDAWHMFETDPNRIAFGIMQPIAGNIFGTTSPQPIQQNQILTPMTHSRSLAYQQQQQQQQQPMVANYDQQPAQQQQQQQHPFPLMNPQSDAPLISRDSSPSITDTIRDSSSSASSSNDKSTPSSSSFAGSMMDSFKNGISSRSSIVKAISDNKVARTLSTVGKTIGGNKYVAGAAAASALAALGLTMTKLFKPYVFSSGYSKIGDPMIASGSMLSPAFGYGNTDRTLVYSNPMDTLFGTAKPTTSYASPMYIQPDGSLLSSSYDSSAPIVDQSSSYDTGLLSPSASYSQPSYLSASPSTNNNVFVAYNPIQNQRQSLAPMRHHSTGQQSTVPTYGGGDSGGHYSNFYAQQGMNPSPGEPSVISGGVPTTTTGVEHQYIGTRFQQPSSNDYEYRQYLSSQSAGDQSEHLKASKSSQQDPMMYMPTTNEQFYSTQETGNMYPASSYPSSTTTARRSGPIPLKLDDATRSQLYEQLERLLKQQPYQPVSYVAAGSGQQKQAPHPTSDKWMPHKQATAALSPVYVESMTAPSPSSHYVEPQRTPVKSGRGFDADPSETNQMFSRTYERSPSSYAAQPQQTSNVDGQQVAQQQPNQGVMDASESSQQYRLLRPNSLSPSASSQPLSASSSKSSNNKQRVVYKNNNGWLATSPITITDRPSFNATATTTSSTTTTSTTTPPSAITVVDSNRYNNHRANDSSSIGGNRFQTTSSMFVLDSNSNSSNNTNNIIESLFLSSSAPSLNAAESTAAAALADRQK